jgi:hypothetical protein
LGARIRPDVEAHELEVVTAGVPLQRLNVGSDADEDVREWAIGDCTFAVRDTGDVVESGIGAPGSPMLAQLMASTGRDSDGRHRRWCRLGGTMNLGG